MSYYLILLPLVAITIHRLWLYEQIFAWPRARVYAMRGKYPKLDYPLTALTCPMCFAFWACVIAYGIIMLSPPLAAILSAYGPVRALMWATAAVPRQMGGRSRQPSKPQEPSKPTLPMAASGRKVVILTSFMDFNPSYSLIGVVLDHVRALLPLRPVQVIVMQGCDMAAWPKDLPQHIVTPILPRVRWQDDTISNGDVATLKEFLKKNITGEADVLSHDFLFLASHVSMAKAIHEFPLPNGVRWWNIAHSAPSAQRTGLPYRATLPKGHRLISLAPALVEGFARLYDTSEDNIDVVQNVRLLPELRGFEQESINIIRHHDLDQVDACQVYPMSLPRANSKGLRGVFSVFGAMKARGMSVRVVLPLAHGNGPTGQTMLGNIRKWAEDAGLSYTDVHQSKAEVVLLTNGAPGKVVQDLQQIANVFICPTVSEASPLALMEAAMAGQVLVVNEDVPSLKDVISTESAYWFSFGREGAPVQWQDAARLARAIEQRLDHPREHARRDMARWHGLEALQDQLTMVLEGKRGVDSH